jgi:uncharacterized metal-binding protein
MSSGKTHDKINGLATLATLGLGVVTLSPNVAFVALGIAIGTIWLSPDLDMSHSLPAQRLGPIKLLLIPYTKFCGHHRSFISHSPIVSSIIRVLYFGIIPALLMVHYGHEATLRMILTHEYFWMVLLGLEIATDIHLVLDVQHSIRKKFDL